MAICYKALHESMAVFLYRGMHHIIDRTKRNKCQYQNNQKENKTAQAAILETFSARNFYAVKYPVGHKVEAARNQCVVNDFQVNAPKWLTHAHYIMSPVIEERDSANYPGCDTGGVDSRVMN